ncbi:cation:proton antiporter [Halegenticoccus tardaugens]|uniref:cation:proton antiporter n=1 Tax=Halegenticoccus tardaugens TaxID=2071624 RepID=UPI00100B4733|nr:cation:proton antiporter [Halegenticoccus tardaugens]
MADVELYLIIGAGLLLALVLSEAIERLGEPGFLGEILTGVVFGPSLLMLVNPRQGTPFELFALLGGVLLFFDVGYEQIDLDDLLKAGRPALIIGLSGILLPFATGVALGFEFGYRLEASLYLGLILGVTSISIVVRTLMSLERLDTEYGRWILGASVVDDVIGLLSISLLPLFFVGGSTTATLETVGVALSFFLVAAVFYRFFLGRISGLLSRATEGQADFMGVMGLLFLFSYAAEAVRLSATIGALTIGLIISTDRRFEERDIRGSVEGIAYGIFIPLYFIFVGSNVNLRVLADLNPFIVVFTVVGLLSNFVAGYVGNILAGGKRELSIVFGVGLLPRSEAGVALVALAVAQGIVPNEILIAYLVMFVLSVFATPSLLKRAVDRADPRGGSKPGSRADSKTG